MTHNSNRASNISRQILEALQQLILLNAVEEVMKDLNNGADRNEVFPLLQSLIDCAEAQTISNPSFEPIWEYLMQRQNGNGEVAVE